MEILRKTAVFKLEQQTTGVPIAEVTALHFAALPLVPHSLLIPFCYLRKLSLVSLKPALVNIWEIPFYAFPKLEVLDVSDNRLTGEDLLSSDSVDGPLCLRAADTAWKQCESPSKQQTSSVPIASLKRLHLANNRIAKPIVVAALAQLFAALEVLELADNPVVTGGFRGEDAFALWPKSLVACDGVDASGRQVEVLDSEDDEEDEEDESDEEEEDEDDEEGEDDTQGQDDDGLKEPPTKTARLE